jgi:hypothetical protein
MPHPASAAASATPSHQPDWLKLPVTL